MFCARCCSHYSWICLIDRKISILACDRCISWRGEQDIPSLQGSPLCLLTSYNGRESRPTSGERWSALCTSHTILLHYAYLWCTHVRYQSRLSSVSLQMIFFSWQLLRHSYNAGGVPSLFNLLVCDRFFHSYTTVDELSIIILTWLKCQSMERKSSLGIHLLGWSYPYAQI